MVSFKSLLLTTLFLSSSTLALPAESNIFEKRAISCHPASRKPCNLGDARNCYAQLLARNEQKITVGTGWTTVCQYGNCRWSGRAVNAGSAASFARDVGYGGYKCITDCSQNGGAGCINYAGGNGNFQLDVHAV